MNVCFFLPFYWKKLSCSCVKHYFSFLQLFFEAHWHPKVCSFFSTLLTLYRKGKIQRKKILNSIPHPKEDRFLYYHSNLLLSQTLSALQKLVVVPNIESECPAISQPCIRTNPWSAPPLPPIPLDLVSTHWPGIDYSHDKTQKVIWTQPWEVWTVYYDNNFHSIGACSPKPYSEHSAPNA